MLPTAWRGRGASNGRKPYARGDSGNINQVSFTNDTNNMTFIADSGATEHVTGKGLFLSNFKKCRGGELRSANENRGPNIKIDGMGNLSGTSNSGEHVKLTQVIKAGDIARNLISLRKFADMGMEIILKIKR